MDDNHLREIARMTNEQLERLTALFDTNTTALLHGSSVVSEDGRVMLAEITQLRGNLSLAEEGLANAMQEIERLQVRINGYADTNVKLRTQLADLGINHFKKIESNIEGQQAGGTHEPGVQHGATFRVDNMTAGASMGVTVVADGKILSITDSNGHTWYRYAEKSSTEPDERLRL